jgi:uncharacterized tellurite resistance protein B-like protein
MLYIITHEGKRYGVFASSSEKAKEMVAKNYATMTPMSSSNQPTAEDNLKFLHDALSYVQQTCDGLKNDSADETREHLNQFLQCANADADLKDFVKTIINRVIDLREDYDYNAW